jgi:hypothetical protein
MSHTSKIPPAKYATSDLPTDLEVGSLVFDSDTSEHKVFNGSSWDVVSGESFGTATIVSSNTSTYDQIQGNIPSFWKNIDASVKGLVIGTSCTSIGTQAFDTCYRLTGSLIIPDSVTSIGSFAFSYCSNLSSLTIGNSVTIIGSKAFNSCISLTGSLTIPDSVGIIGGNTFKRCNGFTGSLIIGNSVTTIGSGAFYYCSGFTGSLVIPDSVTSIGTNAFRNCSSITGDLVIPDSVTTIGDYCFQGCSSINTCTINSGNLLNSSFRDLTSLTTLVIYDVTSIQWRVWRGCNNMASVYINVPASKWQGEQGLNIVGSTYNIYVHPDYIAGYDAAWRTAQYVNAGVTISTWTNYPNIP